MVECTAKQMQKKKRQGGGRLRMECHAINSGDQTTVAYLLHRQLLLNPQSACTPLMICSQTRGIAFAQYLDPV